jgi:NAD(P)H dehydrogenase (quinone)
MTFTVTGTTGQLGSLVIKHLLKKLPSNQIVAVVRNQKKLLLWQILSPGR